MEARSERSRRRGFRVAGWVGGGEVEVMDIMAALIEDREREAK